MKAVENVAIVGAGNMGSGIAQKSAQEAFNVQMVDREEQYVARGRSIIENFLSEAIERRIFSQAEVDATLNRITEVIGVENTAVDTDLVIEAVFEDFDIKTAVFSTLDEVCGEDTILASNTSSLSVNALAEATGRPDRFVGLHFFTTQLRIDSSKSFLLKRPQRKPLIEPFNTAEHSEKLSSFAKTDLASSSIVSSFLGSMKHAFFLKRELRMQLKSMQFLVKHSESD